MKWDINKMHQISLGAGLHSKVEPVSIYLAEQALDNGNTIIPNKDLDLTKATHMVLGYNWNFAKNFRLKAEVYYQYLYDVPVKPGDTTNVINVLNFSSGFTNEKLVNKGTGRNYGAELTLQKFFSNNWYLLVTASLFESKYNDFLYHTPCFLPNHISLDIFYQLFPCIDLDELLQELRPLK